MWCYSSGAGRPESLVQLSDIGGAGRAGSGPVDGAGRAGGRAAAGSCGSHAGPGSAPRGAGSQVSGQVPVVSAQKPGALTSCSGLTDASTLRAASKARPVPGTFKPAWAPPSQRRPRSARSSRPPHRWRSRSRRCGQGQSPPRAAGRPPRVLRPQASPLQRPRLLLEAPPAPRSPAPPPPRLPSPARAPRAPARRPWGPVGAGPAPSPRPGPARAEAPPPEARASARPAPPRRPPF